MVMKQVEEDGFNISDFKIHQMTTKILSQIINEAAAEVLDAVMKQVAEDGFNLSDFKTHQMTTKILSQVIIKAATEVLDAVDQCIRSHSREKVLY
ncbi:Hypothetical predicted protein [Mytilus galloprovincialis]|uniref:Uncharacterized protein n=1 Tax=Mytilus galloprovincialis TaxID=29158 RepID=A0A8B6FZ91_MYTGA|nr:Hypothetical predicted protein [Mytilus galloprovincialis]